MRVKNVGCGLSAKIMPFGFGGQDHALKKGTRLGNVDDDGRLGVLFLDHLRLHPAFSFWFSGFGVLGMGCGVWRRTTHHPTWQRPLRDQGVCFRFGVQGPKIRPPYNIDDDGRLGVLFLDHLRAHPAFSVWARRRCVTQL